MAGCCKYSTVTLGSLKLGKFIASSGALSFLRKTMSSTLICSFIIIILIRYKVSFVPQKTVLSVTNGGPERDGEADRLSFVI